MGLNMRAIFLLAVITGGECARMSFKLDQEMALDKLSKHAKWFQGGNEVCREPEINDADAMMARWMAKATKMRALAAKISSGERGCLKSCLLSHKALGQRMNMWDSCFKIQEELGAGAIQIPQEMLTGSGKDSLTDIVNGVHKKMMTLMMKRRVFATAAELDETGALDGCSIDFNAVNINDALSQAEEELAEKLKNQETGEEYTPPNATAGILMAQGEAARAHEIFRQQLFGAGCNREMQRTFITKTGEVKGEDVRKAIVAYDQTMLVSIDKLKTSSWKGQTPADVSGEVMSAVLESFDGAEETQGEDALSDDEYASLNENDEVVLAQLANSTESKSKLGEKSLVGSGSFLVGFLICLAIAIIIFLIVCFANLDISMGGGEFMMHARGGRGKSKCFS